MKLKALNKGYPKLDFLSNVEFVDAKEYEDTFELKEHN